MKPVKTWKSEFLKITLPALAALAILILCAYAVFIPNYRAELMDARKDTLRDVSNMAMGVLEFFHQQEIKRLLSREEAQRRALEAIRQLRYGPDGKDYFWINDFYPTLLMHPYRPDLEGNSLADFQTPDGKLLFATMVDLVKQEGGGFIEYVWQLHDDRVRLEMKLSYLQRFKPWDWILGTGLYITDLNEKLATSVRLVAFVSLGVILIVGLLGFYMVKRTMAASRSKEKALSSLETSRLQLQAIFDHTSQLVGLVDMEGRLIRVNRKAMQIAGVEARDVIGLLFWETSWWASLPREQDRLKEAFAKAREGQSISFETRHATPDSYIQVYFRFTPVEDDQGEIQYLLAEGFDISNIKQQEKARRDLEIQLRQSQKMEAVGILASGVAHDFNNILQAVTGSVEVLSRDPRQPDSSRYHLEELAKAVEKAAALVRQLLTFSRKHNTRMVPDELNRVVEEVAPLLERTIPKMIVVNLNLARGMMMINADAVQLEQVLVNLANNAGDAMPDGGVLSIETSMITVSGNSPEHLKYGVEPGRYCQLTVSDTGLGITRGEMEHIFEPFYTTKEVGKGTGLGLSTVFGIVRAHNGHIFCESQPGHGSEFRIFLPALDACPISPEAVPEGSRSGRGQGVVLLVDDENTVLNTMSEILKSSGYQVLSASSGEAALDIFHDKHYEIDVVVLDLGMPGMGGKACLARMKEFDERVKVIVASGYADEQNRNAVLKLGARAFLPKPYRAKDLLSRLEAVLAD